MMLKNTPAVIASFCAAIAASACGGDGDDVEGTGGLANGGAGTGGGTQADGGSPGAGGSASGGSSSGGSAADGGSSPGGASPGGSAGATGTGTGGGTPVCDGERGCACRALDSSLGGASNAESARCDGDLECWDGYAGEECLNVCAAPSSIELQSSIDSLAGMDCDVLQMVKAADETKGTSGLDFSGLSSVLEVDGNLLIPSSIKVAHTLGFDALRYVSGNLTITDADSTDLSEFGALEEVGGELSVYDMDDLVSLDGLAELDSVSELSIFKNPVLPDSEITDLEAQILAGSGKTCTNNSGTCTDP